MNERRKLVAQASASNWSGVRASLKKKTEGLVALPLLTLECALALHGKRGGHEGERHPFATGS
jgi:hypothetical protein